MSEPKSLTLDKAKAEIENERSLSHYNAARVEGLSIALSILTQVEQPSEEEMAVLWLIREWAWNCFYDESNGWYEREKKCYFNPAEEARKLGWKP